MSKNQVTLQMFRLGKRLTDAKFASLFLCIANISVEGLSADFISGMLLNASLIFT